ncbi:MAG: hypothetical protein L3J89_08350 [Gammaproteobacteria bacterium]|nr:hypothetical protein [Gammaproteobacteria bacterium]
MLKIQTNIVLEPEIKQALLKQLSETTARKLGNQWSSEPTSPERHIRGWNDTTR